MLKTCPHRALGSAPYCCPLLSRALLHATRGASSTDGFGTVPAPVRCVWMPGTPGLQTRVGATRHTDHRAARQATPQSRMFEPTVSEYRADIALHKRWRPADFQGDDDAMPDAAARQAEAPIRELRNAAKRRKVMAEQDMQQAMQQAQPAQQAMQAMQQYSAAVGELARREKELAALKAGLSADCRNSWLQGGGC
eukprot:COSAG01_NODE_861_length_13035_cov_6.890449_15_plen_195_part_00